MKRINTLYVMVGCPGSGKSTFCERLGKRDHTILISRDSIRFSMITENDEYFSKEKEVYAKYIEQINHGLWIGFDVFADATQLNKRSRKKLLSSILHNQVNEINAIYMKTPLEECIKRNENRRGTRSFVPVETIEQMYNSIQEPSFEEGFNKIYTIENGCIIERRVEWETFG